MVVNDPPKPVLQRCAREIHKKPDRLLHQTKIGQQLFEMGTAQAFHTFDFDEKTVINK